MAWEARSGLKLEYVASFAVVYSWLNGLGSPFGIETVMGSDSSTILPQGLNGLGSPFGIETKACTTLCSYVDEG